MHLYQPNHLVCSVCSKIIICRRIYVAIDKCRDEYILAMIFVAGYNPEEMGGRDVHTKTKIKIHS